MMNIGNLSLRSLAKIVLVTLVIIIIITKMELDYVVSQEI